LVRAALVHLTILLLLHSEPEPWKLRVEENTNRMKSSLARASAALCLATVAASCGGGGGDTSGAKLVVVASIFPLYDLARRVGGEAADVRLLLPPGRSEHDFDPTVAEVKSVADAKLAFLVGLEMDEWLTKTVEASGGGATVVRLGDKVTTRPFYAPLLGDVDEAPGGSGAPATAAGSGAPAGKSAASAAPASGAPASAAASAAPPASAATGDHHDEDHDGDHHDGEHHHEHGSGPDPHIWMSVPNAIKMADAMAVAMTAAAPGGKATFEANVAKLKDELGKLQEEVKARTGAFTKKGFITFHGSFGYFADAYDLNIVAIIEPSPGKEPTPAYLNSVLSYVKGKPVGALYIEPQLDPKPGEVLAKEAGLPLLTLDPIGGRPDTDSYEKLIRFNVDALEKSLK
jgi:zinc transport system substrate-binding protein